MAFGLNMKIYEKIEVSDYTAGFFMPNICGIKSAEGDWYKTEKCKKNRKKGGRKNRKKGGKNW